MEKKKLIISFSGGRTSAYMLWWIWNCWEDRHNWEIIVVFCNTGKEAEGTYFFIDEISQEWNIPINWIEYRPGKTPWAVSPVEVTYETVSKNGEPFELLISTLGIPSSSAPFCSQMLKRDTLMAYARMIGWKDYKVAIGIRADEPQRISEHAQIVYNVIYPLAHIHPTDKRTILNWWKEQPFDLDIHPDEGNCDFCWKKDFPRLTRNINRIPKKFVWWQDMTLKYGHLDPRNTGMLPPFNFFRGNTSPEQLIKIAKLEQAQLKIMFNDPISSCAESCEPF